MKVIRTNICTCLIIEKPEFKCPSPNPINWKGTITNEFRILPRYLFSPFSHKLVSRWWRLERGLAGTTSHGGVKWGLGEESRRTTCKEKLLRHQWKCHCINYRETEVDQDREIYLEFGWTHFVSLTPWNVGQNFWCWRCFESWLLCSAAD